MAYEVQMYFEVYRSGELTMQILEQETFSDLSSAVKKFDSLRKNTTDIAAWKKTRKRVHDAKLAKFKPEDFEDGYAEFHSAFNDKLTYTVARELSLAFGFDHETLYVQILDSETKEVVKR